ncbi:unnamed protein product, partial [Toxocara canis]|uniref:Transposase n=1 Tax=Toxocara canis TaxID=6265 RepID=A0A183U8X1_TOXCA
NALSSVLGWKRADGYEEHQAVRRPRQRHETGQGLVRVAPGRSLRYHLKRLPRYALNKNAAGQLGGARGFHRGERRAMRKQGVQTPRSESN